jgi:hypothetical protein
MLGLDDIAGGNHVFETVVLCDDAAFFTLAAYHEDSLIRLGHFSHRCVPTNELSR